MAYRLLFNICINAIIIGQLKFSKNAGIYKININRVTGQLAIFQSHAS
jgi:hypothetical protein